MRGFTVGVLAIHRRGIVQADVSRNRNGRRQLLEISLGSDCKPFLWIWVLAWCSDVVRYHQGPPAVRCTQRPDTRKNFRKCRLKLVFS